MGRSLGVAIAATALCALDVLPAPPLCNWDLIAYTAVGYESTGLSGEALHRRSYDEVARVCPDDYASLTQANAYRVAVAASPAALTAWLPFYRGKVLYAGALGLAARTGASPARAAIWIGRAGYLAMAFVTALWLAAALPPMAAVAAAWLFLSIPGILEVGRLATPDSVSVPLLVASAYLAAVARKPAAALAVALPAVWVRPDNILWLALLALYVALRHPARRVLAASVGGVGVALHVIGQRIGGYGWSRQIYQEFVLRTPDPAAPDAAIGLVDYPLIWLKASHPAHLPPLLLPMILIGAGTLLLRRRLGAPRTGAVDALALALAFIALHWLAYPAQDRFLVASYLIVMIVAATTLAHVRGPLDAPSARPAYETASR